jgi:hypothetical protein
MNTFNIDLIADAQGEPRILDVVLAERLGMRALRNIRPLIAANREELEGHGEVCTRRVQTQAVGGRPGRAYLLNEGQALVICALSRTPSAAKVRKALIDVFMAFRRGELTEKPVLVREHRRALPSRTRQDDGREALEDRLTSFFAAYRDQPEALASWAAENIFALRAITTDLAGIGF